MKMFKRSILIFVVCVVMLSLSSCVTSNDYNIEISCDQFTESNHCSSDVLMEVGDKIILTLCSNPSTGFSWEYEVTTANVVKEEGHDFEEPEEGLVGAPGKELWTFEAVERGNTEIQMEYSRPWEGGTKAEWTYIIKVTVE